jgi:putative hydrolase of the HAD superfamily
MIRGVLFDYGETLVRSVRPWIDVKPRALRAVYSSLEREGLKCSFGEFADQSNSVFGEFAARELKSGRDFPDLLKYRRLMARLFPRRSMDWRRMMASEANSVFWRAVLKNYKLQRNAHHSLDKLRGMGSKLAVVSNHHNPDALVWHLEQIGILEYFSPVIVSAQMKFRKPDRRIFAACLSSMDVAPHEAVFVGDSMEYDVAGAEQVGMITVLMKNARKGDGEPLSEIEPDYVISDLIDVPRIVAGASERRHSRNL